MSDNHFQDSHTRLTAFIPVANALVKTLGPDYEIALCDVSGGNPVIVTPGYDTLDEQIRATLKTQCKQALLHLKANPHAAYIANRPVSRPDGVLMRGTTVFIKDDTRAVVGLLCINFDMTRAAMLKTLADFLVHVTPSDNKAMPSHNTDPAEQMKTLLNQEKKRCKGAPLRYANKIERQKFLDNLDKKGFFSIKGAIDMICSETGKSQFTIYRDLREIRAGRQ